MQTDKILFEVNSCLKWSSSMESYWYHKNAARVFLFYLLPVTCVCLLSLFRVKFWCWSRFNPNSPHFISTLTHPRACSVLQQPNIITLTLELVQRTVQSEGLILFLDLHAHCACFREPTNHYVLLAATKDETPVCSLSVTIVLVRFVWPL